MNGKSNADVHALTGAYVLDAVSADERAEFERHLADCEACRREVAELRETAARLGIAAATPPPPGLRTAVLARISQVRQLPPESDVVPLRRRGTGVAVRLAAAAAAVLLVTTTVLGVLLARTEDDLQDARARAEEMATILQAGDAEVFHQGDPDDGGRMTVLASRSANRVLLLADGLPPAPSGHDYQAWTMGAHTRSAGLIVPDDGQAALAVTDIADAAAVGITIEPAGGSDSPTTEPIMEFDLE